MNIAKRFLVALLVAGLLLAGCGQDPPKTGRVLDKTFQPAWTEEGTILTCMAYGQYGCTVWYPMPYTTNHPDRWDLFLENCDKVKKNGEPQCFKGYREVDSVTFENTLVGDYYNGPTKPNSGADS